MEKKTIHEPTNPNPALIAFAVLIGEWEVIGTHPLVPNTTLTGHCSFKWIEEGAFISWHSEVHQKEFPKGVAIFGSDDAKGEYIMLYYDERKVSRKYKVSFKDNVLKWWRDAPGFSQRYTWTISDNGNTIIGKGELSKDGTTWEKDLEQTFTRRTLNIAS
jgi:hypothetical protein